MSVRVNLCLLDVFSPASNRLCIQTPRTGSRLLETGDENLLNLADNRKAWNIFPFPSASYAHITVKISVIVVFTKFDLLINEHFKNIARCEKEERKQKAQTQAQGGFEQADTEVRRSHSQARCVKVSTHVKYRRSYFSFPTFGTRLTYRIYRTK